MSTIDRSTVEHIALLARLRFAEDDADCIAGQLTRILDYVEKLDELDTSDVEPTLHARRLTNVLREDAAQPSLAPDEALANAPDAEAGCFKVPPIIQET